MDTSAGSICRPFSLLSARAFPSAALLAWNSERAYCSAATSSTAVKSFTSGKGDRSWVMFSYGGSLVIQDWREGRSVGRGMMIRYAME